MRIYRLRYKNLRGRSTSVNKKDGKPKYIPFSLFRPNTKDTDQAAEGPKPGKGYPVLERQSPKLALRPCHSVLCGENGVGKSVVLQIIAALAFLPLMKPRHPAYGLAPPGEESVNANETFVEITLAVKGPNGKVLAGRVQLWCPKDIASNITETLISGDGFEHWTWAASSDDLAKRLIQIAIANHPLTEGQWKIFENTYPENEWGWHLYEPKLWPEGDFRHKAGASPDLTLRANTYRARLLQQLDEASGAKTLELIKAKLAAIGTVVYVNTDLDEHGMGLHICESPKNIKRDLPAIFHYRIPATCAPKWTARNIEEIALDWEAVFSRRDVNGKVEKRWVGPKSIRMAEDIGIETFDRNAAPYDPNHLSSGQNEVLTISLLANSAHLTNCVLLCDEPELHLTGRAASQFFRQLSILCDRFDMQTAIATHAFSAALCQFVLVYNVGRHDNEDSWKPSRERFRLTNLIWGAADGFIDIDTKITAFVEKEAEEMSKTIDKAKEYAAFIDQTGDIPSG